jgi:hypothetical protein
VSAVTASQSFGFETTTLPLRAYPLSTNVVADAVTV